MKLLIGRISQNTTAIIDFQGSKLGLAQLDSLFLASCVEELLWLSEFMEDCSEPREACIFVSLCEFLMPQALIPSFLRHLLLTHEFLLSASTKLSDILRARQPPHPEPLTFPTTIAEVVGACMKTQ
jgi:hypothetical protein